MSMEPSLSSIQSLVSEIKKDIFFENAIMVSPSAYDTAWLAMIPEQKNGSNNNNNGPMFRSCLNWIVENQKEGGFWGETNEEDLPTIDTLPATLACLLALDKWNVGHRHIQNGLQFIYSKAEILLKINYQNLPRWFVLVFPAMIELAEEAGLDLVFPTGLRAVIANIFVKRQQILEMEELVEESRYFPPLISYMEALPSTYDFDTQETVKQYLSSDGSLFQSPSATAQAFMATGNVRCLNFLRSLVQKFPSGVPAKYPMDGDLIKLCMVDHVQGLGVAELFNDEIEQILAQAYRNIQKENKSNPTETNIIPIKLFKDALAFRLLRMQGYDVNPGSFCWFLQEPEILAYTGENREYFISAMYNVYRATNLQFPGETELEEARKISLNILESYNARNRDLNFMIPKGLQNMINYELSAPWTARLDRLHHRKWIEENKISPLWNGKASFYRLCCLDDEKLLQLAVRNFEFQQSIYMRELEELKEWSKKWRLSEMGFGREKTVYTYFAISATSCIPHNSIMRLVIAKTAIIITVADDFYDMEGSLNELEFLTDAVKRWDSKGLSGHSKTIFDALDDLVNDIAADFHPQERSKIVPKLQDIWREAFMAWMVERRWSLTGYLPSMDEYLETGMRSIAAHTVTLPATSFLTQEHTLNPFEYSNITKLLMTITRLANDTQSYQKEQADGKINLVLLHMKQNPNTTLQDSIDYVQQLLEEKTKEFLKHVFMDGFDEDMPKSCRHIHLSCLKVFQMFFNSANLFDSETALLDDIKKAIYLPIDHKEKSKPLVKPLQSVPPQTKKKKEGSRISTPLHQMRLQHSGRTGFTRQRFYVKNLSVAGREKLHFPMKFNLCFT
ncbi:Alpha-farnesene synthase [Handroanthus impetiginosus]|uniref:Alpha-farnesene synthase n=1 Tax=Handroanthus impetiginosus TaxID=429701 RepID=A0A2G9HQD4_9LAMI|nr:Alpha-farnesene synthase [Handroanthus impetiginosus]